MPYQFTLHRESLKRRFAVYVVLAKSELNIELYVGKVGDNRDGCNPLISRCGNHFSYNKIHSQVRNKIYDHEDRDYTYIFDHFDEYENDASARRIAINRINEMERWLNQEVQIAIKRRANVTLLNPYRGTGHVKQEHFHERAAFRTPEAKEKIEALISMVLIACDDPTP